jgi:hypothetical protein
LSNTDNKLLAALINYKLNLLAATTATPQQRGFVRGRSLVDNVLEVEAMAIHLHRHYYEKSGVALFDFSAAFPSLSHKWLFAVLQRMGIPPNICKVLRQLYTGCRMNIIFGGVGGISFEVNAGIKQGCPASGSLFALALDPFLRMMMASIPPRLSTVVAFADDLAVVLLHLFAGLRTLQPIFALLFQATGLALNLKKDHHPDWGGHCFSYKEIHPRRGSCMDGNFPCGQRQTIGDLDRPWCLDTAMGRCNGKV